MNHQHQNEEPEVEEIDTWNPIITKPQLIKEPEIVKDLETEASKLKVIEGQVTEVPNTNSSELMIPSQEDSIIHLIYKPSKVYNIPVEYVGTWMAVRERLMQEHMAMQIMRLFTLAFILSIVASFVTHNILIALVGAIIQFASWVIGYFFQRPKK